MINKGKLQSIISKYFLNGRHPSVKWEVSDKKLTINFGKGDVVGIVKSSNIDLEDQEIGVYDTKQLLDLVNITNGELDLSIHNTPTDFGKLIIADMNFTLKYSLGELLVIPPPTQVADPNQYSITSNLDSASVDAIIKAKSALSSDLVRFTVTKNYDDENVLTMIFGDSGSSSNKIEFIVPETNIENNIVDFDIPFDSETLKIIFNNNKDFNKCLLKLNLNGLLQIKFLGEDWESYYYVVRKEKI